MPLGVQGRSADIIGVEAIDIFVGLNTFDDQGGIDVGGQRQLNQDAIDRRILIELVDQIQQRLLIGLDRQIIRAGDKPDFLTGAAFAADIDLRGGILTDQHDGQSRRAQTGSNPLLNFGGHTMTNGLGNCLSIDNFG